MSDLTKTIEIIFQGTDNLSSTIGSLNKKLGDFSSDISDATKPLADLGKNILAADTALNTLAAGGLVAAKVKSEDFKAQMNELNTILQLSPGDLSDLSQSVLSYAQNSTQSLDQITTALYAEASAGTNSKDIIEQLTASEKLAIGSKSDLGDTAQTLASIMNAYGASVQESADYSDTLFTIVKDGITTMPELSTSISQVTGIASNAGIDFDTLGAAIAGVTAAGTPTSQAMTQLKAAISAIVSPSSQAQKAAKDLGIELGQAAIDSKGFPAVIQDIYDKTNGSQAVMKTFIPSVEGLQAVISLGADKSGVFAKSLDDMTTKAGATQTAFDQMKDNLDLVWQNILNNVSTFAIKVGDKIDTSGLSDKITAAFQGLSTAVDAGTFDPIINAVNGMIADVTDGIGKLADNLPEALESVDFSGFTQSIKDLGQSILDIFNIDLSSSSSLTDSIQGIVDAFTTLNTTTSTMINVFDPIITAISGIISWYTKLDEDTQTVIATILGVATVVSPLAADIAAVTTALSSLGGIIGVGSTLLAGITAFGAALGPVGLAITAIGTAAAAFSLFHFSSETEDATKKLNDQKATLEDVKESLKGLPESAVPAKVQIDIDRGDYDQAIQDIAQAKKDYKKLNINVTADTANALNEINNIPTEKQIEIKLQGDIDTKLATIKANAETLKSSFEWNAKVDIAQAETQAETIKANADVMKSSFEWTAKLNIAQVQAGMEAIKDAYESINTDVQSTSDTIEEALGHLGEGSTSLERQSARDILFEESLLRQKSFDLQEQLVNSQIAYQEAQTERLNSGGALIEIDSSGLEPALEMVMWEIIQKVQVKAAQNPADFLLGLQ